MQTQLIKFNRPLTSAVVIPVGRQHLPASSMLANGVTAISGGNHVGNATDHSKLTTTANSNPAKNAPQESATQPASLSALSANDQLNQLLTSIQQQINQLSRVEQEILHDFQELAIQLATQIASAVVQYEVTHHETRIRNIVSAILIHPAQTRQQHATATPSTSANTNLQLPAITVRVHPTDWQRLQHLASTDFQTDSLIHWSADPAIAIGDCEIETKNQSVVANCQRQISDIHQQLMESLHDARTEHKPTNTIDFAR